MKLTKVKQSKSKLTPLEIARLHDQGIPGKEIAKRAGVTDRCISQMLRNIMEERFTSKRERKHAAMYDEERWKLARKMWDDGFTVPEIAREYQLKQMRKLRLRFPDWFPRKEHVRW